jgi:cob(I)alamin adenosyltransferase
MVRLTRIYTRGGDKGDTSLGDGARVAKHDPRVAAYGTVDEANATIGLARLHLRNGEAAVDADAILGRVQNDLFDLGADLCRPESATPPDPPPLRVTAGQVVRLEGEIDRLNADLAPLTSFVLPGGTPGAAYLHLARTVVRRAEREMTALARAEAVNPEAIRYINRLSDLLFVLARGLNNGGAQDVLWEPGRNI